ncbi:hypothetical protein [Rhodococcus ruber]|uniref:hypothetical protein n=1 Tax=Rhodococcus ruber TaxID=1830 RepID=UPI00265F1677|nr:hypothetical protein [Rhodococcus ruber]MDO1481501.1 hypothetical protein [Rhodococcus ruber]
MPVLLIGLQKHPVYQTASMDSSQRWHRLTLWVTKTVRLSEWRCARVVGFEDSDCFSSWREDPVA